MSWLLVGNDDGVDSPALVPFAAALERALDLPARICVPAGERSWSGKAVTRHGTVRTEVARRDGRDVVAVHGTPADAVQLGLHSAFASEFAGAPPAAVVTGVNLGYNSGSAFLASSGTVWAAAEAALWGVPAVAVSTGPVAGMHDFAAWREEVLQPGAAASWSVVAEVGATVVRDVVGGDALDHCDLVSVNLPFDATATTTRRVSQLTPLRYGPLFVPEGPDAWRFTTALEVHVGEHGGDGDVAALADGYVSITPVVLPRSARLPDATRRALEG